MKNILIIILFLLSVNVVNAQLISSINSDIPKLNVKQDVQILSELTWNINELNDREIQIQLLQKRLQFQNISTHNDNLGYRYISASTPDYTSSIELVLKGKQLVFGNLTDNAIEYVILEENKRYFLAERTDTYQPTQDCGTSPTDNNDTQKHAVNYNDESKSATVLPDDNCNVRVLILYTDDVANANTNAHLTIQTAIARMNTSFNNSLINHDVEIALIEEVSFAEFDGSGDAYSFGTVLNWMENDSDGVLDYIHDLRDLYDADMVQMVTTQVTSSNGNTWCGWASAILADASDAFALTAFGCLNGSNDHTLTHEFGHLYGCRHDSFVDSGTTPFPFSHGYVNVGEGWRTIMAYNDACDPASCGRISYFSNPGVDHPTTGSPTGIVGDSDNEATIDFDYPIIVNLQDTPVNKTVWDSDTVVDGDIANIRGETSLTTDVNQPYNVYNGGIATFIAGDNITLRPGFRARPGSSFRAFVGNCTETQ